MPLPFSDSPEPQQKRTNALGIFIVILFILYAYRLFSMQILSGEKYQDIAENISKRVLLIPTQRGEIYDRNFASIGISASKDTQMPEAGILPPVLPLVQNKDSFAVNITPAEVPRTRPHNALCRWQVGNT